jgi:lysophospholipase L1-like esterase
MRSYYGAGASQSVADIQTAFMNASVDNTKGLSDPRVWGDALKCWRSAFARRATRPARIIYGPHDSIGEGIGASALATGQCQIFADVVQGAVGQAIGHLRYVPLAPSNANPFVKTGTATAGVACGLGMYSSTMAPGAGNHWDIAATQFDRAVLVYSSGQVLTLNLGTARVTVDATPFTIDTSLLAIRQGRQLDLGAFADTNHSVKVDCSAGGALGVVQVEGMYFFRGEFAAGIQVWRNCHSAFSTPTFTNGGLSTASGPAGWVEGLTDTYAPDLVIIGTGTNDIILGGSPTSDTLLTKYYSDSVDSIRPVGSSAARTLTPSIVIAIPPSSNRNGGDNSPLERAAMATSRAKASPTGAPGVAVFNGFRGIGTHGTNDYGYLGDALHPNDAGHRTFAEQLGDWVLEAGGLR